MALAIVITLKSLIEVTNLAMPTPEDAIVKPEPEEAFPGLMCTFTSDSNVYDYDGNVLSRDDIIQCNDCNQYIWKREGQCGQFEYDVHSSGSLDVSDIHKCKEFPLSRGICPFSSATKYSLF